MRMLPLLVAMPGKCSLRKCEGNFISQNMHPINFCCRALHYTCMQAASMVSGMMDCQYCNTWKEQKKKHVFGISQSRMYRTQRELQKKMFNTLIL